MRGIRTPLYPSFSTTTPPFGCSLRNPADSCNKCSLDALLHNSGVEHGTAGTASHDNSPNANRRTAPLGLHTSQSYMTCFTERRGAQT